MVLLIAGIAVVAISLFVLVFGIIKRDYYTIAPLAVVGLLAGIIMLVLSFFI